MCGNIFDTIFLARHFRSRAKKFVLKHKHCVLKNTKLLCTDIRVKNMEIFVLKSRNIFY